MGIEIKIEKLMRFAKAMIFFPHTEFFAVDCDLRLAHLPKFTSLFCFAKQSSGVQFRHSLRRNLRSTFAKKFLIVRFQKISLFLQYSIKSKILIFSALFLALVFGFWIYSFAQEQAGGNAPQIEGDAVITESKQQADEPADAPEAVQPEPATEEEINEGVKVSKERISLDLKGIDIAELFRILSLKMGLTIVPSKSVSGRVNIFLNNLTFEDALDVILISQDLAGDKKGNIIAVMTAAEYEKLYGEKYNEKRKFKSVKLSYAKPAAVFAALGQVKSDIGKVITDEATGTMLLIDVPEKLELMESTINDLDQPLATEVFDLKYAKAADAKTHLTTAITAGPGELFVDERTSKVVVSDLPEKMKKIKRIVRAIDAETKQVFIEAEIIQITLKDEFQRGLDWEKIIKWKTSSDIDFVGTFPVSPSFTPSPLLSAANLKWVMGVLANDKYTSTLKLLQSFGDTKILSRPRIAAINNQEAKVLIGSREAFVSSTLSQAETTTVTAESIEFIDVGVKLNVVPTINDDGFITMKIKPEVSTVRETKTTNLGSIIPIVETSEAETTVKVKDGTMVMIAGLMKEERRNDRVGMPFLNKIPIIGAAFGSRATLKKTTEIVVFLTPQIIRGDVKIASREMEKLIPADIMPEDIGDDIISDKIDGIKVQMEKKLSALDRDKDAKEKLPKAAMSRLKGIKE